MLYIGLEIARGLEYLHPTIVHRDLKVRGLGCGCGCGCFHGGRDEVVPQPFPLTHHAREARPCQAHAPLRCCLHTSFHAPPCTILYPAQACTRRQAPSTSLSKYPQARVLLTNAFNSRVLCTLLVVLRLLAPQPANVLLSDPHSPRPVVKLADFGLARLRCTVVATKSPEAGTVSTRRYWP